jgi:hypothetical protein
LGETPAAARASAADVPDATLTVATSGAAGEMADTVVS